MLSLTLAEGLTLTSGRLLIPLRELHALLERITGVSVMAHEYQRAWNAVGEWVRRHHPALARVEVPERLLTDKARAAFLSATRGRYAYGNRFVINELPASHYYRAHPVLLQHCRRMQKLTQKGEVDDRCIAPGGRIAHLGKSGQRWESTQR